MQSKFVFQGRIQFGFYIFLFLTYTVLIIKQKRGKTTRRPFLGTRVLHTKKQKRGKKNAEPIFGKSMSRATSIFAVWSKQ